ncbi:MAG: hypothetical protein ACE5D8_00745 [Fidelibacterota bacterium]
MMKPLGVLILCILLVACESPGGDSQLPNQLTVNTEDITSFGHHFNFTDQSFVKPYDIAFRSDGGDYIIQLNSEAGVRALSADSAAFESAVLPLAPYLGDTLSTEFYVIGNRWIDSQSGADNIMGNGNVWFIRTTDYHIVKFVALKANPDSITFRYAVRSDNGFESDIIETVALDQDQETSYDFTTGSLAVDVSWDMAFYTIPIFVPEIGNVYMPHIALSGGTAVAVLTEGVFDDIVQIPETITWLYDSDAESVLGYLGLYAVLVYHPEPPYNHQVIIEHPEYIYLIRTAQGDYKLTFDDYGAGALIFTLAELDG